MLTHPGPLVMALGLLMSSCSLRDLDYLFDGGPDAGAGDVAGTDDGAPDADSAPTDSGESDSANGCPDGSDPICCDGYADDDESDIDCGGSKCMPCGIGQRCDMDADCCASGDTACPNSCQSGLCFQVCENRQQDGLETDVDCGGGACVPCHVGAACVSAADCLSGMCDQNVCRCPVPFMVEVSALGGARAYCIDAIEVTRGAYDEFLRLRSGVPIDSSRQCRALLTGLVPSAWAPPTVAEGSLPVGGVSWCQAEHYCEAYGYRLCGAVGGGTSPPSQFDNALSSQWFNACSAGGTKSYPYVDGVTMQDYAPGLCNGADFDPGPDGVRPSIPSCEGGFFGLFDMSGNVWEWEDSCDSSIDLCLFRGGGYQAQSDSLMCTAAGFQFRSYQAADLGFRCCTRF